MYKVYWVRADAKQKAVGNAVVCAENADRANAMSINKLWDTITEKDVINNLECHYRGILRDNIHVE